MEAVVILFLLLPFLLFGADTPELGLEMLVEPKPPYYPGQKLLLGYNITYRGFVALSKEDLPLLEGAGLEKIGEPAAETKNNGTVSEQRFFQYFIARAPGTYSFPVSVLEGVSYKVLPSGQKALLSENLRAEVKPFSLTVLPFPESKPRSFNGALGNYAIETSPLKTDTLRVGEPFPFEVAIKGEGEIDTVSFPNLLCQKGWGGFFTFEVPPKLVEKTEGEKRYSLSLIPLSDEVHEIPPIAFSSFDLKKSTFGEVSTSPFPVAIKAGALPPIEKKVVEAPFHLSPLSLIPTGLIALIFLFYRSPLTLVTLLPLLVNLVWLIFQKT